jgi:hypothetical protein
MTNAAGIGDKNQTGTKVSQSNRYKASSSEIGNFWLPGLFEAGKFSTFAI